MKFLPATQPTRALTLPGHDGNMSRALSIPPSMSSHCGCGRNRKPSSPLIRIAFAFVAAHRLRRTAKTAFLASAVGSEAAAASSAWSSEEKDGPVSIPLQPISSEAQFDRIVAEAQQLEESFVVVWMAAWCRKCIYLKPKLEKLAVDYHPSIRFYSVDVNTVPQRLVTRAGILKMPTIQLWKDGMKQAEVIGVHKAWLVVNDVREMIENES